MIRFILKVRALSDTPALIQFVASEEDHLLLCGRIVNAAKDRLWDLKLLQEICRKQDFDFSVLKEKLIPVARALDLVIDESDYYKQLGVLRDAAAADIKKAFRKRVIELHPDTGGAMVDSSREFIHLKTAYQILSDPFLRKQYDKTRRQVINWTEKVDHTFCRNKDQGFNFKIFQKINQNPSARTKIFYQLGALLLLLVFAVFIFDYLYRQNFIFVR